jgi:HEAT repeat protein
MHLVASPEVAVRMINEKLKPTEGADPKRIAKLVEQLNDDSYAVRESASEALQELGKAAEEALKKAAGSYTLEVKRRAEELVRKLEGSGGVAPAYLRKQRAIEVLERIGSDSSRRVLKRLLTEAKGDAHLVVAIQGALGRLGETEGFAEKGDGRADSKAGS